jgi:hypothetical protein
MVPAVCCIAACPGPPCALPSLCSLCLADMLAFVEERGFEMPADLQPRKLPFVFVFGR